MKRLITIFLLLLYVCVNAQDDLNNQYFTKPGRNSETYEAYVGYGIGKYPMTQAGLQGAINELQVKVDYATRGVVYVAPGTINLDSAVTLYPWIYIAGEGAIGMYNYQPATIQRINVNNDADSSKNFLFTYTPNYSATDWDYRTKIGFQNLKLSYVDTSNTYKCGLIYADVISTTEKNHFIFFNDCRGEVAGGSLSHLIYMKDTTLTESGKYNKLASFFYNGEYYSDDYLVYNGTGHSATNNRVEIEIRIQGSKYMKGDFFFARGKNTPNAYLQIIDVAQTDGFNIYQLYGGLTISNTVSTAAVTVESWGSPSWDEVIIQNTSLASLTITASDTLARASEIYLRNVGTTSGNDSQINLNYDTDLYIDNSTLYHSSGTVLNVDDVDCNVDISYSTLSGVGDVIDANTLTTGTNALEFSRFVGTINANFVYTGGSNILR